jgi:hypothetical protein
MSVFGSPGRFNFLLLSFTLLRGEAPKKYFHDQ